MKLRDYMISAISFLLLPHSLSFATEITLTDSIKRATAGFPVSPSISNNGSSVYCVYQINVDRQASRPANLAAEIFRNNNSKLQSVAQLFGDQKFVSVNGGFANRDFTKFCVIDSTEDSDTVHNFLRVRIFDESFKLLSEKILSDYRTGIKAPDHPAYSIGGGSFSPDGQYIAISYLINDNPGVQKSVISILDANQSLLEKSKLTVEGGVVSPSLFSYGEDTYVTFTSNQGNHINAWDNLESQSPSTLFVYRVGDHSLDFADSLLLPRPTTDAPTIFNRPGEVLIGIGTVRADLTDEVMIFSDSSKNQSYLSHDARELRIYSFDGKLTLHAANETGLRTNSPTFFPESGRVLVNLQAVDGAPGFLNFFKLKNQQFEFDGGTYATAPFESAAISKNEKWLIVTGSDQSPELNNINLYLVK